MLLFQLQRLRLALAVFLLSGLSIGCTQRQIFILDPSQDREQLLHPCSRPAIEGAGEYWKPSSLETAALESGLVPFLETDALSKAALPLEQYHRQYIGFTRYGKRYIYGNFYRAPTHVSAAYHEATQPVLVCGGGRGYWGVAYGVESKSFSDFAFNGPK
jgi:hypothetical protein